MRESQGLEVLHQIRLLLRLIRRLLAGLDGSLERHAAEGWTGIEDFHGIRRDRVAQSEIRRPDAADYRSGYERTEGYAGAEA